MAEVRVAVPAWVSGALSLSLVSVAVGGIIAPGPGNILPGDSIIDFAYIATPLLAILFSPGFRLPGRMLLPIALLSFYIATRAVIIILEGQVPLLEALRAHKWALYISLLALVTGLRIVADTGLIIATKALIAAAAVKYLLITLLTPGQRPTLILENNYEIALFCGLYMVLFPRMGRRRIWFLALLAIAVALSGSRSGAVALLVTVVYVLSLSNLRHRPLLTYVAVFTLVACLLIAISVFEARSGESGQIDRVLFLEVFLQETRDWDLHTWLIGSYPLTELSTEGCAELSWWADQIGVVGEGGVSRSCYSVVLHAFLVRAVFDFGLVGTALIYGGLWYLMRSGGVSNRLSWFLLASALVNSASVSGPNNAYVMLPIMVAVLVSWMASESPTRIGSLRVEDRANRVSL